MYLIVIHVPFQPVEPGTVRVASDWARSLRLLRDSLDGRCGSLVVAAPSLPVGHEWLEQRPTELVADKEHIAFVRLYDENVPARKFWARSWSVYRRCLALAREADVVHAGMCDLFRPVSPMGLLAAVRAGAPSVFVEDNDTVAELPQLRGTRYSWRWKLYAHVFERVMRWAVARADLSLLKGETLHRRYAKYAKNAKDFHDTSYAESWSTSNDQLEEKITELAKAPRLRCVSLGRLVARKGIDHTLQVVTSLRDMGVPVALDIIGDGPDRERLEAIVRRDSLGSFIRFLGARPYGRELLDSLRTYHLMLFTPLVQETPRALFDGFAAGLPLAAYSIDYVESLLDVEQCVVAAPVRQHGELAREICNVWADRNRFCALVRLAVASGRRNSAEAWYTRRAAWTFEAVECTTRFRSKDRS